MHFACFFSCKIKGLRLKQAYASLFMQNMYVERLIENIRPKVFINFHRIPDSFGLGSKFYGNFQCVIFSALQFLHLLPWTGYCKITPGRDPCSATTENWNTHALCSTNKSKSCTQSDSQNRFVNSLKLANCSLIYNSLIVR